MVYCFEWIKMPFIDAGGESLCGMVEGARREKRHKTSCSTGE